MLKSAEKKLLEATIELCRKRQKSNPNIPKGFKVRRAYVVLADDEKQLAFSFAFSINLTMIDLIIQEMTILTRKFSKDFQSDFIV